MTPEPSYFDAYVERLRAGFSAADNEKIALLARSLREAWRDGRQVFVCGNGGSAANAMHIANDLFYGAARGNGLGIRAHALCSNQSVVTCLANDVSYEEIFSRQIAAMGRSGDLLLALSGSGNSGNILKAIETAKRIGMKTFAILGYSGGKCLAAADVPLHFAVDDMQISEDLQLIVGHMITQWLRANPPA